MSGVANRDEAERCLGIATAAFAANDLGKAKRFAEKTMKLHQSDQARLLLKQIERKLSSGEASTSSAQQDGSAHPAGMSGAGLHSRTTRSQSAAAGTSSAPEPDLGTPEQKRLVRKIVATKDYYEMLGVVREATDDDLKRGYRKLALKLHPDKNKAAGAAEAFKAVSRAYACLSDADKRANYDRYGHEDSSQVGRGGGGGGAGVYQDQFDPDELFNMFFGGAGFGGGFGPRTRVYTNFGGVPFGAARRRPPQQGQGQAAQQANLLAQLAQFVPVLILLLFTFFSSQSEPVVSLDKQGDHTVPLSTQRYNVPFFVKSSKEFQKQYPYGSISRNRLEQTVEVEYKDRLEKFCHREKMEQARAARWGSRERAQSMELPHCDEIFQRFGYRYSTFAY